MGLRMKIQKTLVRMLLAAIVAYCAVPQVVDAAGTKPIKRVLIFNVYGQLSSPGVAAMDEAIVAKLQESPYQIELYSEDMEATLFPNEQTQAKFRQWYVEKYRDRKPDVIITVGPDPLKFMVDAHESAFPGTPIVFCGSTQEMLGRLKLDSHFTGVWGVANPENTLKAALRLKPDTKHVVVVGGVGTYDRYLQGIVRESFRNYESSLDFTYLTDLEMSTLLERLRHLPSNTIVYHTSIMQDAGGSYFIDATQSVPLVAEAASAPVFVVDDVDLGRGTVGGNLLSFSAQGQVAAAMAIRLLNGESVQSIPIVRSANVNLFDGRALRRWGLSEANLPSGSVVLNRQPTLWESHKWLIIDGILLIALESLLILAMVWQRRRRRKAEAELAIVYDRLRLAVEAGKPVGWEWDVKNRRNKWFGDLQSLLGITSEAYEERIRDSYRRIHPEDRKRVWKAIAVARKERRPCAMDIRVVGSDGSVRWFTARGRFHYSPEGDIERMLGMAVDITERKAAEEELMNLSRRLIDAQEEERKRIARDIHDDYNQRLAVMAIDLEDLAEHIANSPEGAGKRLHELWNRVSKLGDDLHSLSHNLHSSTLESLGLVIGVRAFCQEFSDQQGIQVDFAHENIPRTIPGTSALCLFRVAQEALRNVKRHSGSNRAEVRLEGFGDRLWLSITDRGSGFVVGKRTSRDGIGIRSMEERLRALGGQLDIHSQPSKGTRVEAWLPASIDLKEPVKKQYVEI